MWGKTSVLFYPWASSTSTVVDLPVSCVSRSDIGRCRKVATSLCHGFNQGSQKEKRIRSASGSQGLKSYLATKSKHWVMVQFWKLMLGVSGSWSAWSLSLCFVIIALFWFVWVSFLFLLVVLVPVHLPLVVVVVVVVGVVLVRIYFAVAAVLVSSPTRRATYLIGWHVSCGSFRGIARQSRQVSCWQAWKTVMSCTENSEGFNS